MKKILLLLLSALILFSACACSAGSGSFDEIDAFKLPSKIDLRDYEGKNYVTPVKSQRFGDCWAFALSGAAEVSYLFSNDMGVPAGEINDRINFSEKYIVWYTLHGITEDDVTASKVRSSQIGEGFDLSQAESSDKYTAYFVGGPYIGQANLFGCGFGPIDESVSVNGEYPYAYDDEASVEWFLPLNAPYRSAPTDAFLRNSCMLPSPASFDKDGNYIFSEEGLIAVKSALSQGYGVSLGLKSLHPGFNPKTRTAYYEGSGSPDHAVTVIGYDDDFPKEKFTRKNSDGEIIEGSTPPSDGAFIIKNSWGFLNDGEAEDGYCYLSYYDRSIVSPLSFEFDRLESLRHTDLSYDQYDLMMTQWYGHSDYDTKTQMANVFSAEEDASLFQIAYVTSSDKTEVSYEIYQNIEEDNPSSGILLEKGVSRHLYSGFHRINLKGEYELKKGDRYAVVLTMKHVTDEDGDMTYTEVFPYSTPFFEGMTVCGIINPKESYLYAGGKWTDMADLTDSLTERAYQQGKEEIDTTATEYNFRLDSKDFFTVDNYPIKAILY